MSAPQLLQEMAKPLILPERTVALDDGGITLGDGNGALAERAAEQGAQRFDTVGKGLGELAHASYESRSARLVPADPGGEFDFPHLATLIAPPSDALPPGHARASSPAPR